MKRFFIALSFLVSGLLVPTISFAQCAKGSIGGDGSCTAVDTAIGKISTSPQGFVGSIMGVLLGFSGGIAILLIIASGYEMVTSQGNPEKVKAARERLTSAIVGLLFTIFSVAILQFIGVTILQIPGLHP